MKIALVLGMGPDGGGTCKHVQEFKKVFPQTVIFVDQSKKHVREKAHVFDHVKYSLEQEQGKEAFVKQLSEYETVILFSTPSAAHSEKTKLAFLESMIALKNIRPEAKLVYKNLAHTIQSCNRSPYIVEIINVCDMVVSYDKTGPFYKKYASHKHFIEAKVGFSFDDHRNKYWKDINEQDDLVVRWVGRATSCKKGANFSKFADKYLCGDVEFKTIIEGLEPSITWETFVKDTEGENLKNIVNKFRIRKNLGETKTFVHGEEQPGKVYLYPPFVNAEMLQRMSKSAFGASITYFQHDCYGNAIEFCQSEIVASGAVPIFSKRQATYVKHKVQGDPVVYCKDSGTLFFDEHNPEELANQLKNLYCDRILRDEMREKAFAFWKAHTDGESIYKKLIEEIESYKG